jgi:GDPmannose 4,6-dehydratase|tara:strand:- start:3286 stop:4293 length:1008 start_codon:yes stop_codon:yes gene_type:complete
MKKALISGITGQDGSYLAEFLLKRGYEVYGMYRRTSLDVFDRLGSIKGKINMVQGDITDTTSLFRLLKEVDPDEVYNLAAQSFVPASWTQPISTGNITAIGTTRFLEAIRLVNPKIKFYQASSSEMFGKAQEVPQTEKTPFYPRSPYGVAKVYAYWITVNYKESYGLHTSNGILFNHESPRRGKQFVTRKITHSVARIVHNKQDCLELGNLDAKRDWGYAGDYVEAMWLMLQQKNPDNYVIATGESHSVREFVEETFEAVGMDIEWLGKGEKEVGKHKGKVVVKVNPKFCRPAEVELLIGDPSKAKKQLGWNPKTTFKGLVKMMTDTDLELVKKK